MSIRVKHIVITRLAVNWVNHKNFKQKWDGWLGESIKYMDLLCRPSLKNQTNQNFTLLTLVDDSVNEFGDILPNEKILNVRSNKYTKENVKISTIRNIINERKND